MTKEELTRELNNKVKMTIRFIDEVLISRDDITKPLLMEFRNVLTDFQNNLDIYILKQLREIDSRPVPEGVETDFTTGISLQLDGKYTSLSELMLEIEDLVFRIDGGEN